MKISGIIAWALLAVSLSAGAGMEDDVARIRDEWARIKYQIPGKEQEAAFEKLAKESETVAAQHANRAEPAIWHGIIEASYAGAKGGLGALALAKSARKSFEHAVQIDPKALEGSAYTSLGSLYYQVPGWPLGFGDNKKALDLLRGFLRHPKRLAIVVDEFGGTEGIVTLADMIEHLDRCQKKS